MEYIQLANWQRWTSNAPAIFFSLYYKYYRKEEKMVYKFKVIFHPLPNSTSPSGRFSYPVELAIGLNGVSNVATYQLKGPGSWGNDYLPTWSEVTYESPEITTSTKLSGTTPVTFRIYSWNGSTRDSYYNYNLPISESAVVYINNEPYQCYIGDGTNWNLYTPYIGDETNWNEYGFS